MFIVYSSDLFFQRSLFVCVPQEGGKKSFIHIKEHYLFMYMFLTFSLLSIGLNITEAELLKMTQNS